MSTTASKMLVVLGTLAGLFFFKWFLIPIGLWLFLAAILLYLKKIFKLQKWKILVLRWLILTLLMRWIRLWWSQIIESLSELWSSIGEAIQTITRWVESRLWVSLKSADAQAIFNQIQWLASTIPYWSFSVWFASIILDCILVVVYSFLFVLYEKKILNTLNTFFEDSSKYWNLSIKKSAQYIGSMGLIAMVLWVMYSIILSILWVDYAILIAISAAICTLVPTVGTAVGILGATIATYAVTWSPTATVLVFVSFEIVQLLEEYTILPAIAWRKLKINPLATILGIVFGWMIWWVAWIFLILPIVSIIQEIVRDKNSNHRFIEFTQ